MKRILVVLLVILLIGVIVLTILAAYFFRLRVIPPACIGFWEVNLQEDSLGIIGTFPLDSLNVFKKYKYEIRDSGVYITIYGRPKKYSYESSDFHIKISDDFSGVKKVYLEGGDQQRLMYSLDEQE